MIKSLSICFFCFLFTQSYGQSENNSGTAYYKKSLVVKTENSEINSFDATLIDVFAKVQFVLDFSKNESTFQFSRANKELTLLYNIATLIGGGKGVYYTNVTDSIHVQQRKAFGKEYIIESMTDKFQWELLNETKIIEGYTCYKAKTFKMLYVTENELASREVEAWYSKELPVSHGPIGYEGLPGLIMELREGRFMYTLQKLVFDKSVEILKPVKGEIISEKAFEALAGKTIKNRN